MNYLMSFVIMFMYSCRSKLDDVIHYSDRVTADLYIHITSCRRNQCSQCSSRFSHKSAHRCSRRC